MTHAEQPHRLRGGLPWVAVALVIFYVLVRLPLLAVPLERDEGLYGVIGQAILRGELPYRDVFEQKPPGVFYIYALGLLAVPPTAVGLHSFLLVWNLATAVAVAAVARILAGPVAALWTFFLFTIVTAAPSVQGSSASVEMLALLPLVLGLLTALAALRADGRRRFALLVTSGALGAATFWIKQPAFLAAASVPLLIAVEDRRGLGAWVGGAVLVSLGATVPFALLGAWREFWYWTFTHPFLYAQQPVSWGHVLLVNLNNLWPDVGLIVAAAIAGGVLAIRRRRPRAWLPVVFLVLSCVSALHSTRLYKHYFALLAPAVALAGGTGLALLQEACGRGGAAFGMLAATLVLALPVAIRPWYWLRPDPIMVSNALFGPQGFEAAPLLAAYVRERTTADERIFVFGSEPQVALEARRRDVNPFVTAYAITWDWPRHREFQERVWSEIERWRPTYTLVPHNPFTRLRSPRADPFFEEHLTELGRRAYRLEALVVRGADGRPRLSTDPAAATEGPASVLFEVWRRTG